MQIDEEKDNGRPLILIICQQEHEWTYEHDIDQYIFKILSPTGRKTFNAS